MGCFELHILWPTLYTKHTLARWTVIFSVWALTLVKLVDSVLLPQRTVRKDCCCVFVCVFMCWRGEA